MAIFFLTNYKFRRITIPNINLYKINNFKPFEEKYFNKKSIATNEEANAVVRPTTKGRKLNDKNWLKDEINSTKAAKEIAGMPKMKENLAESTLSQPATRPVEIVTPDLETPGKIAKAWASPIKKLSEYWWFFKFIEPFFELSAIYIKKAIRKETIAIDKLERRKLSKKLGTNNFMVPPSKTIGIVPIKIDQNNLSCNK